MNALIKLLPQLRRRAQRRTRSTAVAVNPPVKPPPIRNRLSSFAYWGIFLFGFAVSVPIVSVSPFGHLQIIHSPRGSRKRPFSAPLLQGSPPRYLALHSADADDASSTASHIFLDPNVQLGAEEQQGTTPPGTPTVFAFPLPSRATFPERCTPIIAPNSAAREMFPILEIAPALPVEPIVVIKRVSGTTTRYGSPPNIPRSPVVVMDELFSFLDDVHAEFRGSDGLSLVSIPLTDSETSAVADAGDEDDPDLDGEVAWRIFYSLTDEYSSFVSPHRSPLLFGPERTPSFSPPEEYTSYFSPDCASFFSPTLLPGLLPPPESKERQTLPSTYSFLVERAQTLSRYHVQGSRSLPDLALGVAL
ncbi:hypothetical protein C8R43DRAFT_1204770 [Mycena crocata]|nr:hypothetical protein C8R43DRAFT_1204770 [Mycena crocata]